MGFITELDVIPVGEIGRFWTKRTIWMLQSPLLYRAVNGEEYEAPTGFQHDFCSVPRWIPFIYSVYGDTAHREGVLHDYVFRRDACNRLDPKRTPVTFNRANYLFREAAVSRGKKWEDYYPMYAGVMIGGKTSFHKLTVDHQYIPQFDFA